MKLFSQFPTVHISKLNFWLVICIANNLIWTTLKVIFLIFWFFLHPQIPDFSQILSYPNKPYINGKFIYSAFKLCINLNFKKKLVQALISTKCEYAVFNNYSSFTNVTFITYLLSQSVYICLIILLSLHLLYCIFKFCSMVGDFFPSRRP